MYLSHFQLACKPFQISSDPKFLWLGEKHKEAFAVLKYCILDNKGFLLLTGDVGTGKTTLINALVNSLGSDVIVATVPDPRLMIMDFLNYIAAAFGSVRRFESKGEFLQYFYTFLHTANQENKQVLLIIDEAQRLHHDLLEEIRVLSNIEKQGTKLLNIFFVGQDELNGFLNQDRNRAVRQRITISHHVAALNEEEVQDYIAHRLKVAGTEEQIFSTEAIREILNYSGGFPRTINIICDHAMLTCYVKGERWIDRNIILECVEDLRIPEYRRDSLPERATITGAAGGACDTNGAADPALSGKQEIKDRQTRYVLWFFMILSAVLSIIIISYHFDPYALLTKVNGQWTRFYETYGKPHADDASSAGFDNTDAPVTTAKQPAEQLEIPVQDDEIFSSEPNPADQE